MVKVISTEFVRNEPGVYDGDMAPLPTQSTEEREIKPPPPPDPPKKAKRKKTSIGRRLGCRKK